MIKSFQVTRECKRDILKSSISVTASMPRVLTADEKVFLSAHIFRVTSKRTIDCRLQLPVSRRQVAVHRDEHQTEHAKVCTMAQVTFAPVYTGQGLCHTRKL